MPGAATIVVAYGKTPSLKKKLEKVMVRVEETRMIQKDF